MRDYRMITTCVLGALLAVGVVLGRQQSSSAQTGTPATPAPAVTKDCNAYHLNTTLSTDLLIPAMPLPCAPAVSEAEQGSVLFDPIDRLQHGFDLYSWLTFVALNSPVDGQTRIGQGPESGGDAPSVWESYKQLPDVMLEDGSEPSAWGEAAKIPDECGGGTVKPGTMVVRIQEETFNQPFKSGPLIDQNGSYALFVILMNRDMFQYIVDNRLYTRIGQKEFSERKSPQNVVDFPIGTNSASKAMVGAVMVKASWKVLGENDDPSKFHKIDGLVYTPATDNPKAAASCVPRKLGLIGFHVGHKTDFNPQWVWTTFEHIANAPEQADVDSHRNLRARYNFFDATCDQARCPFNQAPPPPWNPAVQPFPAGFKSQITRVIPLTTDVVNINNQSQSVTGIKGTVWENYMLVSTQWPTDFRNKTDLTGVPAPTYLANTTLETYSQGQFPLASSSCIGCHLNATTASPRPIASDFTYILEKAR